MQNSGAEGSPELGEEDFVKMIPLSQVHTLAFYDTDAYQAFKKNEFEETFFDDSNAGNG